MLIGFRSISFIFVNFIWLRLTREFTILRGHFIELFINIRLKYIRPWTQNRRRKYFGLDLSCSIIHTLELTINNWHGHYFHWWSLFLLNKLLLIMQIVYRFLLHCYYIFQFINSLFQSISVIFSFFLHDFLTIGERLYHIFFLLKQFTLQLIDGAIDEKPMVF